MQAKIKIPRSPVRRPYGNRAASNAFGSGASIEARPRVLSTADIADDQRAPPKRTPFTSISRQESVVAPLFLIANCDVYGFGNARVRYGRHRDR